jgi:hypothetical protein
MQIPPPRPVQLPGPDSLKVAKTLTAPAVAFGVARAPGTTRVFLGASDFKVSEADLAADKFVPKELYAHASYVTSVALAGTTLVSGGYDGKLVWFDTKANKKLRETDAHQRWVRKVVASPDGKTVASVADDMVCRLWDAASGAMVKELRGHAEKTPHHFSSMLYALTFSADGQYLATGDKTGHVVVWDVATGKEVAAVEAPVMYTWDPVQRRHSIGGVRALAFSPDGRLLAVGGTGKIGNIDHLEANGRVEVFDWRSKKSVAEMVTDKSKGLVNKLQFAPDGSWLFGCGGAGDGFVAFFDVAAKKVLRQEKMPMHAHDFTATDDFKSVVVAGHNKVVVCSMG